MTLFFLFLTILNGYNPEIFGINFSNIFLSISVLIVIIYKGKIKNPFNRNTYNWCIGLFFILVLISNIWSINHTLSIPSTIKFMMMTFVPVLVAQIVDSDEKNEAVWKLLIYSNALSCCVGIIQVLFGLSDYHLAAYTEMDALRATGAFPTPNIFANYICLTIPIILLRAIRDRNKLMIGLVLLNLVVLYETYSRSSVLALIVSIVIWKGINSLCISHTRKMTMKTILFGVGVTIAIILGIVYLFKSGKLSFLFQSRWSNVYRIESIKRAINLFLSNPIGNGIGVGSGEILDGAYFNILVDLGFVGITLVLLIAALTIRSAVKLCKKNNNNKTQAVLLATIILWVCCLLENIIYNTLLMSIVGIYWFEMKWLGKMMPMKSHLMLKTYSKGKQNKKRIII